MSIDADRRWIDGSFRKALDALAAPGEETLRRLPDDVTRADERTFEFDNSYSAFVGHFGNELKSTQHRARARIDALLDAMSRAGAEARSDEAVRSHPAWQRVRDAASRTRGSRMG